MVAVMSGWDEAAMRTCLVCSFVNHSRLMFTLLTTDLERSR